MLSPLYILIILYSSVLYAAQYHIEPEPRLIGGHEADPHSHPYMVSLQKRFLWLRLHMCGGTIISKNWVLTAAHCVPQSFFTKWLPLDAIAGIHDNYFFGPKAQIRTIIKQIRHPSYKGGINTNDIAMLRTLTPFKFTREIQPVNLPHDFKFDQERLILSGWGILKTSIFMLDLPETLQEVEVTYLPYDECYQAVEEVKDDDEQNPLDEEANICTGPITGGVAACNGDSGGPLVLNINKNDETNNTKDDDSSEGISVESNDGNVTAVLLGIVSWGMVPCGEIGAPTIYTKVSSYLDFIQRHISK